jgi:hypothetical protein
MLAQRAIGKHTCGTRGFGGNKKDRRGDRSFVLPVLRALLGFRNSRGVVAEGHPVILNDTRFALTLVGTEGA